MKSSELLNLPNLDGFRICRGYSAELKHGLSGFFPALITESKEVFMCLSKEAIKRAVCLLPKREFKINKSLFLINEKEGIAFHLSMLHCQYSMSKGSESLSIITDKDLEKMKVGDLEWAPGLVNKDMTPEEFEETLELAMERV